MGQLRDKAGRSEMENKEKKNQMKKCTTGVKSCNISTEDQIKISGTPKMMTWPP
jgi:hypothetical protein